MGHWQKATTYRFGHTIGGSRVTNMNPWNCHRNTAMSPDKYRNLTSYMNVTGIIEEEQICTVADEELEKLPTESSKTKSIPFALDPKFQQPCRFGLACTRLGCLFQHPTDMPITEGGKLVDVDVYVSMIERNTNKTFIEEIGRKHGKVLYICMPKKDVAGKYISKRRDGRFTCNVHFSHSESAMNFIKYINDEAKIPVIAEMRAAWNGIDDYEVVSASKVDWRDSLKNKAARLKDKPFAPQPLRLVPQTIPEPMSFSKPCTRYSSTATPQTQSSTATPQPHVHLPLVTTRVCKVKDAEGYTTIGRNGKAMYTALEIEGDDEDEEDDEEEDELCLEDNEEEDELCFEDNEEEDELCLEENIAEDYKKERTTCATSSTESSPNTCGNASSAPMSPFTAPGKKLTSWNDLTQNNLNEYTFYARSFASLFKAVDASDTESETEAPAQETTISLAKVCVQSDKTATAYTGDGVDEESIASMDSAIIKDIEDDIEDDVLFAKTVAKRR